MSREQILEEALRELHAEMVAVVETLEETDTPCNEFPTGDTRKLLGRVHNILNPGSKPEGNGE